jgi:hypothetical protein
MSHLVRRVTYCLSAGIILLGCAAQKLPPQEQVMRDAQSYFDNVVCQRATAWETPISDRHPQTLMQLLDKGVVKLKILSIERDRYERDMVVAKVTPVAVDEDDPALGFFAFGLVYKLSQHGWKLQL